jgi:hypothetical protein
VIEDVLIQPEVQRQDGQGSGEHEGDQTTERDGVAHPET